MTKTIVYVTGRDPSQGKGGGSSYVRLHARAAQRAGLEPHIFCLAKQNSVTKTDFATIYRVATPMRAHGWLVVEPEQHPERFFAHWLESFIFTPYAVGLQLPFLARSIERFLLTQPGPHIIHGFYTWGCVGLAVQQRLRRQGRQVVVINSLYTTISHEVSGKAEGLKSIGNPLQRLVIFFEKVWNDTLARRWERRAYTRSNVVLLNYESVRQLLRREYGEGAAIRKLPYCSEAAFLREQRDDQGSVSASVEGTGVPLIVAVSRHDPRKGLDVLIRALARLRQTGVAFRACLTSGGTMLATHQRLIAELHLSDLVTLTGWVDDPYPWLQQADIFVLPSLEEGSGSLSLLEALQCGLAIVASKIDGIPEDITDGENGLLIEPGNPELLSQTLYRLLTNARLREQLQRRARETFEAQFSPDALTHALRDLYNELSQDFTGV